MSKTGQWVFEMQEAASHMTRYAFERAYGKTQVHIWDEVNGDYWFEDVDAGILAEEELAMSEMAEEFSYHGC